MRMLSRSPFGPEQNYEDKIFILFSVKWKRASNLKTNENNEKKKSLGKMLSEGDCEKMVRKTGAQEKV